MTNAERLRRLKKRHRLTNARIAEITGYSVDAVNTWLSSPESKRYQGDMSDRVFLSVKLTIETAMRMN